MLRWFGYGFALTIGMFVACALEAQVNEWRRGEEEFLGV